MQTIQRRYWLSSLVLIVAASLLFVSCDKEPIRPTGPDPVGPESYIPITQLRALYAGSDVTVPTNTRKFRGVVISNSANEAASNYRLQDESGSGIYLYAAIGSPTYNLGDVLEVDAAGSGVLTSYNGDLELKSVPAAKVVQLTGVTLNVTPRVATIAQVLANKDAWASTLVQINNITSVTQASSNTTGVTYNVTDASGTLSMFIRSASGITVKSNATSITGYISIYNATTQIGVRTTADIQ